MYFVVVVVVVVVVGVVVVDVVVCFRIQPAWNTHVVWALCAHVLMLCLYVCYVQRLDDSVRLDDNVKNLKNDKTRNKMSKTHPHTHTHTTFVLVLTHS